MTQLGTIPSPNDSASPAVSSQSAKKTSEKFYLLIAGVLFLAHLPMLISLGASMWSREHYQFFPLVLIGAVYLCWTRRDLYAERKSPNTKLATFFWSGTLFCFAGGVLLNSPWLVGVSALGCLWSGAYSLGGGSWLRRTLPVWTFLLIALPLPSQLDFRLINWMQRKVSEWGSQILDLMGYRHFLDGVDLTFLERAFKVAQACSGIHSLFAALCCTVFYLAISRRGFFRYLYLVPLAVFWVMVANVIRILLVTLLSLNWNIPVDSGVGHEALGVFVFVFSLTMIFSSDRFFLFVFPLREAEIVEPNPQEQKLSLTQIFSKISRPNPRTVLAGMTLMVLFGGLGTLSLARAALTAQSSPLTFSENDFRQIDPQLLPEEWNGWRQVDYREDKRTFDNQMGAYSQLWTFYQSGFTVVVSLDSPFHEWHDLAVCYQNIGWSLTEEHDLTYPESSVHEGYRTELEFRKQGEGHQYVFFSAFDSANRSIPAPSLYRMDTTRRFFDEITSLQKVWGSRDDAAIGVVSQLQLVAASRSELTEAQLQSCRELFDHIRSLIRTQATAQQSLGEKS